MPTQTEDEKKATRRQVYAEALDFFITEPEALSDPTLRLFVDFFKKRIAQEEERLAKGIGTQVRLVKA